MCPEIKKRYFAAANTGKGFKSYFEELFFSPKISRRYIIKGGPGTGKSSFMKRIALFAQAKGYDVEYYYCSSDTRSLDGIILNGSIAIFDGTSPHSYDTVLPGACDEIINLGSFWSRELLTERKQDISELDRIKKQAYSSAYGFLASAGTLSDIADTLTENVILREKLLTVALKTYERLGALKNTGTQSVRQVSAFGIHGRERLDTLEKMASKRYVICDYYGIGTKLLREIFRMAVSDKARCYVSYDVVGTDQVRELYFPDVSVWIGISETDCVEYSGEYSVINMKRFVDAYALAEKRGRIRATQKAREACCELAIECLKDAGDAHARLEEIYVSSMDFKRLSDFCTGFTEALGL